MRGRTRVWKSRGSAEALEMRSAVVSALADRVTEYVNLNAWGKTFLISSVGSSTVGPFLRTGEECQYAHQRAESRRARQARLTKINTLISLLLQLPDARPREPVLGESTVGLEPTVGGDLVGRRRRAKDGEDDRDTSSDLGVIRKR